ncbi:MAG TPA: hypothetical protein VFT72_17645 [Opitutaceae bacterium]|nr:hypothetical protein [Opitutaceae bacterium]
MDTVPPPPPAAAQPPASSTGEDKTVAIVGYLTLIGFIIAIILHGNKKTKLGAYHLRQSLGLFLTGIACWVAAIVLAFIPILGWLVILAMYLGVFVLWVMGIIAAAGGEMKPTPVLGPLYQKWFGTAFE